MANATVNARHRLEDSPDFLSMGIPCNWRELRSLANLAWQEVNDGNRYYCKRISAVKVALITGTILTCYLKDQPAFISPGHVSHMRAGCLRALKRFKVRVSFNFTHTLGIYFYKEDNPPDFSWLLPTVREIYDNPPCWH